MAVPLRTCFFCVTQSVQFACRRELIGQNVLSKINVSKSTLQRCLWLNKQHMTLRSDVSRGEQPTVIPVEKLKITYSRSSGPGGQHVNKVNTKAEVRFNVHTAEWLAEEVRNEIVLKNKTRINKAGELIVTSEVSRSQQRNLDDCIQKIAEIISEASQKPPEPSEEDIALRAKRLKKRNLARLREKKIISATKQARNIDFD